MYALIVVAVILCVLFKLLNVNNSPERSIFYCSNANFLDQILKHAPLLNEPYTPPRLWGYSGHIQTIFQGVISLLHCPLVNGRRHYMKASDGATVTYDLYQPIDQHSSDDDITMAICPGICNSSESVYIRRVVYHAQLQGFRVAVLNHVGALKTLPITSPRIFNYGNTADYHLMVEDLLKRFPTSKMITIGFSMGANIVTKYLGESERDSRILAGISVCQGYDAKEATNWLLRWEGFRRLYLFVMTENMRSILRRWQRQLFTEEVKREYDINERAIWSAATLVELDEAYTRKITGYSSLDEFYKGSSCISVWDRIKIPMVFINAVDDPIVPAALLPSVRNATRKNNNFLYVEQKYGGHLGFYEGGLIYPNPLTWIDRLVVQLSDALATHVSDPKQSDAGDEEMDDDEVAGTSSLISSDSDEVGEEDFAVFTKRNLVRPAKQQRPVYVCRKRAMVASPPRKSRLPTSSIASA
jgi:abhydrolase domain-containing protein 2